MGVNSLPKTVTWQRRNCDLNPGPFVPESSMLTIRLLSHPLGYRATRSAGIIAISGLPTWWSIVFVKEISESLPLLTVLLFAKFLLQLNCRLCRCLRPISFHIICHLSLSTFWSCIRSHWQNIESVQTFFRLLLSVHSEVWAKSNARWLQCWNHSCRHRFRRECCFALHWYGWCRIICSKVK